MLKHFGGVRLFIEVVIIFKETLGNPDTIALNFLKRGKFLTPAKIVTFVHLIFVHLCIPQIMQTCFEAISMIIYVIIDLLKFVPHLYSKKFNSQMNLAT